MSEDKTCPKCGSRMLLDKKLGSGAVEASLFKEGEFRGYDIKTYYCRKGNFDDGFRMITLLTSLYCHSVQDVSQMRKASPHTSQTRRKPNRQ